MEDMHGLANAQADDAYMAKLSCRTSKTTNDGLVEKSAISYFIPASAERFTDGGGLEQVNEPSPLEIIEDIYDDVDNYYTKSPSFLEKIRTRSTAFWMQS